MKLSEIYQPVSLYFCQSLLVCSLSMLLATSTFSQLTIWQVHKPASGTLLSEHHHGGGHHMDLWPCGFEYYINHNEVSGERNIVLHVLNEGSNEVDICDIHFDRLGQNYNLVNAPDITLPLTIQPNYQLELVIRYDGYKNYDNSQATLQLATDCTMDPCEILFDSGDPPPFFTIAPENDNIDCIGETASFKGIYRGFWMDHIEYQWFEVSSDTIWSDITAIRNRDSRASFVHNDTLYVLTRDSLHISYDDGVSYPLAVDPVSSGFISTVYVSDQAIFIGSSNGIHISYDRGQTFPTSHFFSWVRDVYSDHSGIYVASSTGLHISTDGGTTFQSINSTNGLNTNSVYQVDRIQNKLILSTSKGLSISTDSGNSFTHYENDDYRSGAMFIDNNKIYLVSENGIYILDSDVNIINHFTFTNSTGPDRIYDIWAASDSIYLSTYYGLRFTSDGGQNWKISSVPHGLNDVECNDIHINNNTVYLSNDEGLNKCNKDALFHSYMNPIAGAQDSVYTFTSDFQNTNKLYALQLFNSGGNFAPFNHSKAVRANTQCLVYNTNDDGAGSLRQVVSMATTGDTVRFHPSINGDTIKLTSGDIDILRKLTIIGNGPDSTIVDGSGNSRIFRIGEGDTVSIANIGFHNGAVNTQNGGAIDSEGSLTLINTKFKNNSARLGGAVFSAEDTNLKISRSKFHNNTASAEGGAIITYGRLYVTHSDLRANYSIVGGAISYGNFETPPVTSTISNTTISGNQAVNDGGAIFSYTDHTLLLSNSTVVFNKSNGAAGISKADGALFLNNTVIAHNEDKDIIDYDGPSVESSNSHVMSSMGNHGVTSGNGVDPLFLQNITGNGGISVLGDFNLQSCSPLINAGSNALISTDSCDIDGDMNITEMVSIDLQDSTRIFDDIVDIGAYESRMERSTELVVKNTDDNGCRSLRYAVQFASSGDTITFDPSINGDTIKLTSGNIFISRDITILGNDTTNTIISGTGNSQIFRSEGDDINLIGLNLQNGSGTYGGAINFDDGTVTIEKCLFANNTSSRGGGAIFTTSKLYIDSTAIRNNHTTEEGGGIHSHFSSDSLFITNSVISHNVADGDGGGAYVGRELYSYNNIVSNNHSSGEEVGVFADYDAIFIKNVITNNTSVADGGGLYIDSEATLQNNTIRGNSSDQNGGGIYIYDDDVTMISDVISGNVAQNNGGGIFIYYDTKLYNVTVSGNHAGSPGGGIYVSDDLETYNSIISQNTATSGAADIHRANRTITSSHSLIGSTDGDHGIVDGVDHNIVGVDPLFIMNVPTAPTTLGDLRLQACSPAIDMGIILS